MPLLLLTVHVYELHDALAEVHVVRVQATGAARVVVSLGGGVVPAVLGRFVGRAASSHADLT